MWACAGPQSSLVPGLVDEWTLSGLLIPDSAKDQGHYKKPVLI